MWVKCPYIWVNQIGSIVRGSIVRWFNKCGSIVRGSIVRGSIVRGSIVRGSIVRLPFERLWRNINKTPLFLYM